MFRFGLLHRPLPVGAPGGNLARCPGIQGAQCLARIGEDRDGDRNATAPGRASRKDARRLAALERERNQPLRDAVKAAEAEIVRLTAERGTIDRALLQPVNDVAGLMRRRGEIERRLDAVEARWLEASEALERAQAGA